MSLLAMGILEKERDFLSNAISYNIQNGAPTNHLQNNLNKTNEAIKELEEYEQKYNQREFDYRTKCQNTLSTERVAEDKVAECYVPLEEIVRPEYSTGFKVAGYESDGRE